MALGDTAKLIASLELQDKFSKPLGAAGASLSKFESSTARLGKGVGQVGAGVGRIATNLLKFGVVGAAAVAGFLGANLKAGTEQVRLLELATVQTNAVLESTKGVAGQTAASVRALAERYESLNATMDDKVIQSAENVLLTFTSIGKEAFPLALDAALNLNQALGGGEEGLQGTIIQVGKALQDPIRGITALRRVGVNFSKEQVKQIKLLVEQNDLFGAQQLILKELGTEFGGSFAAAGDTAAGRTAKVKDNVEDLQRVFAGPFASALDKATGKFGDFLGETATIQRVEGLGEAIAGLFTDEAIDRGIGVLRGGLDLLSPTNLSKVGTAVSKAFDAIKGIDFSTIGKGLEITARIAKTAIDAFLSLPKEVQGIAIAGLAANKLSGGLVGSGLGNIAKGLGGLLTGGGLLGRGSSPANPLWVQSVGGVGGVGGAAGAAGSVLAGTATIGISSLLGITSAVGLGALLGNEIGHAVFFDPTVKPAVEFETSQFNELIRSNDPTRLREGLDAVERGLAELGVGAFDPLGISSVLTNFLFGDEIKKLTTQRDDLQARVDALTKNNLPRNTRYGTPHAFLDPMRGQADLVDPGIARLLKTLPDTAFSPTDHGNWAELPHIADSLRHIETRPTPVAVTVQVANYLSGSLLAANAYQFKTSAKIREG